MKHLVALAALSVAAWAQPAAAQSDSAIKQKLIKESVASYPGNCPCPYNTDRAGRSCGKRSAWSRDGGYAPMCYASDISKADVQSYRQRGR